MNNNNTIFFNKQKYTVEKLAKKLAEVYFITTEKIVKSIINTTKDKHKDKNENQFVFLITKSLY